MGAVQVQHYLGRARDFFNGMRLLQEDLGSYKSSSALLGIHSAISYCDALRIGMGSTSLSSDDHATAVADLRSHLSSRKFGRMQGIDRLGAILSMKSRIAYAPNETRENEIKAVLVHAERFASWAEETGKNLEVEGWRNG